MAPDAVWIAHLGEFHYFGIVRESEDGRRQRLGLVRADCELCTAQFTCAMHTVARKRLRGKTCLPALHDSPSAGAAVGRERNGKQRKKCSRCGQWGHRMDSKSCPMHGQSWPSDVPCPRWLSKRRVAQATSIAVDVNQRTRADRMQALQKILAKQGLTAKHPKVERPPWCPPYCPPPSPGKQQQRRIDRRRTIHPYDVLEDTEENARKALADAGFLWHPLGKKCLECKQGTYGPVKGREDLYRCGRKQCKSGRSLFSGSAWWRSGISVRRCYNLALGFSSRLTPTQASLDKGLKLDSVTAYWRDFRAAMAHRGQCLRSQHVFAGTPEAPCHVELDEAVVKKVRVFDSNGARVGTLHHAVFAMLQRGSRKVVAYLLQPRMVPVRSDNSAGSAPPPPEISELLPFLQQHIGDWVILHTDSARAYTSLLEGLLNSRKHVYLDMVNHGGSQWTKFCRHEVAGNPQVARLRVIAGTQLVEAFWHVLKTHTIPKELRANPAELEAYVLMRLAMWWELDDPFVELAAVVKQYLERFGFDPWVHDPYLTQSIENEGEETDIEAQEDA